MVLDYDSDLGSYMLSNPEFSNSRPGWWWVVLRILTVGQLVSVRPLVSKIEEFAVVSGMM